MLQPEQFIGHRFGPFEVRSILGEGKEAVAFDVWHTIVNQPFVLRIASTNPLWEYTEVPYVIANAQDEKANIEGTIQAKETFHWYSGKNKAQFDIPCHYGLYKDRYLIPISEPIRLKEELDVDQLFRACSGMYLPVESHAVALLFWLTVRTAYFVVMEAYPRDMWEEHFAQWFSGESVIRYIESPHCPPGLYNDQRDEVVRLLRTFPMSSVLPNPDENPLILLLTAPVEKISNQAVLSTLSSIHFHRNVSTVEYHQLKKMIAVCDELGSIVFPVDASGAISELKFFADKYASGAVEHELTEFHAKDPGPFELRRVDRNKYASFTTIVQQRL